MNVFEQRRCRHSFQEPSLVDKSDHTPLESFDCSPRVAFHFILLMLAFVVSICRSSEAQEKPLQKDKGQKQAAVAERIPIRMWIAVGGSMGAALQASVDRFNLSQQEIRVEASQHNGYGATIKEFQSAFADGDPPEIAMIEIRSVALLASRGEIVSLEPLIKQEQAFDRDDFLEPMLKNLSWKNELYAMPLNRSTPVLYFNKSRFREAGLDPDAPPRTWKEFRDAARLMTRKGTEKYGFSALPSPWLFESLVLGAGGELMNKDYSKVEFVKTGSAVLQTWGDMIHQDKSARLGTSIGDFISGEAAMIIESTALISACESSIRDFEFGTAFMPYDPGHKPSVATGGGAAVIAAKLPLEKQQAAWRFLTWASSTDQTAALSLSSGYVPVRKSAVFHLTREGFYKQFPHYRVAVDQMLIAHESPAVPVWSHSYGPISKATKEVLGNNVPAADALAEAATEIERLMQQPESLIQKAK